MARYVNRQRFTDDGYRRRRLAKPKPMPELKTIKTCVRVTAGELAQLQLLAHSSSSSMSRLLVTAALRGEPLNPEMREIYLALIYELRRAAANLNQLTRTLHTCRLTGEQPPAMAAIANAAATLDSTVQAIRGLL